MFALLFVVAAALTSLVQATPKYVFGHVVTGNTAAHTVSTWQNDILLAQEAGLDAFALNIAPTDPNTAPQVANAFAAANANGKSFKLFFSFDYLGGGAPWAATGDNSVSSYLNEYMTNAAYFQYEGQPFVSTWEGVQNTADWAADGPIKTSVGSIYFVPCWTSLGPSGIVANADSVDGSFSWDMWPAGVDSMANSTDEAWQLAVRGKSYMMGVAPWFFRSATGGTNWVWQGDDLWAARWQQVLALNPDFVEIATWNDYGESHYIGPVGAAEEIPTGSHAFVDGMSHDGFRTLLPYYIALYKGEGNAVIAQDQMQYWYRLSPSATGSAGTVVGNNPAYQAVMSASDILQDRIFFTALLMESAMVTVQVGNGPRTEYEGCKGLNHWSQPFANQRGNVTFAILRGAELVKQGVGRAILDEAVGDGMTNFNTWSGGF